MRLGKGTAWLALATVAGAAAAFALPRAREEKVRGGAAPAAAAAPGYSNIRRGDYVGPEACGECHEANYRKWRGSLHRVMNQRVDEAGAIVRGDFSGVDVEYAGGRARFDRDAGGTPHVTLISAAGVTRRYRVTRTIGTRHLQEYVGVQIAGPEPAVDPIYATEIRLPFGWWVRHGAWLHQQYFDSWYGPERRADGAPTLDAFTPDPTPWATRCAWCHNTYAFELRALRERPGRTLGLGPERHVTLPAAASDRDPRQLAALAGANHLPVDELVTVGISCESCHLGGREHAVDGDAIRFVPTSDALARRADAPYLEGGRANPAVVNALCAQCHSTPSDTFPHGGATRNSSEALDLAAGACTSAIRCIDCHDPHAGGVRDAVAACTRCHNDLAAPAAARAHARHAPGTASCLDCHMPRMVQGIGGWVRSHRIASPTEPRMLAAGAPNACNLCHLDRSAAWTVAELARGWKRELEAGGVLDRPMGEVWLAGDQPTWRLVAAGAYARSPLGPAALPALAAGLADPVAYRRMWMLFAVEDTLGRRLDPAEYDPTTPIVDPVQHLLH